MANIITNSVYDPLFYAAEGIGILKKALGMAGRVYRGYDKTAQQRGSTIQIPAPQTFTAQNAPSSAQDLQPGYVSVVLDQWKEVKFALTDKELNYSGEKIISDHVMPAAYALADAIDQALAALYYKIPYFEAATVSSVGVADLINARKMLFNQRSPMDRIHGMVDGNFEAELLGLSQFTQWQGSGQQGVDAQLTGHIGTRFGIEWFANQNVPVHSSGTAADVAGAINFGANYTKGTTTIAIDAVSIGATVKAGDILTITGHTRQYAITADATADGAGAFAALSIFPGLEADTLDNTVVGIVFPNGSGVASKAQQLVFHPNAFALAMAPLTTLPSQMGVKVATVYDDVTGLALRSRMGYDFDTSKILVALDVLFGVAVLDSRKAVRIAHI